MDVRFRNVKMERVKGLCFILWLLMVNFSDAWRLDKASQTLTVKKLLSRLNKSPLKSITSPDGDTIDCVHVSQQPAFDHPLLKNHKIQVRPSYHPEGLEFDERKEEVDKKPITQLWHVNGRCPEGTVPIRRTKEEDVLRASSVEHFGRKNHRSIPKPKSADPDQITNTGHEHAITYVGGKYYGTQATFNVWGPRVEYQFRGSPDEFSLAQLWILGGPSETVEAGWQVYPDLFGDNKTRFFTYWTRDNYKTTGCYNLMCSGFVQTNSEIALGASIAPLSVYGGSQFEISILVWKDPNPEGEGNWWLQFGNKTLVGYWPASLFSFLNDNASMIEWGGEVINAELNGVHTTTQMGSGHFPEEGFQKASFIKNILIVDNKNGLRDPDNFLVFTSKPNCYNVSLGQSDSWGKYFYYGGPGRNPNCP